MAISKYFRPTQHVYQPTYQPLPFKELAATTGLMQNKYEQNVQNLADTAEFAETLPRASFQEKSAEQKLEETRARLGELREKTSSGMDTISPEFNLELGRLVKDIKSDPFWKAAAHNAKMEPLYKKAIYDDSAPIQNRWPLMKQLQNAALASENGEEVLLSEPSVPEYVDYQKRLEEYSDNFMPSGYKKDRITGEWISTTSGEGVDPRLVANILGIDITEDGYGLKNGIPTAFYMSDAGEQLRRDAQFKYDNLDPELKEEVSLRDMENAIYIDAASKLIPKYSGYTTEEGIKGGGRKSKFENPNDYLRYFREVGIIGDTVKSKKLEKMYKESGLFDSFSKLVRLSPGMGDLIDGAMSSIRSQIMESKGIENMSDRELLSEIADLENALSISFGSFSVLGSKSPTATGAGMAARLSKALTSPIKAELRKSVPELNELDSSEKNALNIMLSNDSEMSKQYEKEGLNKDIWESFIDYQINFYSEIPYAPEAAIPLFSSIEETNNYLGEKTEFLFGKSSGSGNTTIITDDEGIIKSGRISDLKIYDPSKGSTPMRINELGLPKNSEISVTYAGEVPADNPYAADLEAVNINGKQYYVDMGNPEKEQAEDHLISSYKYAHDGIGTTFDLGIDNIKVTPKMEVNIGSDGNKVTEYIISSNTGLNIRSKDSIEDAWIKFKNAVLEEEGR